MKRSLTPILRLLGPVLLCLAAPGGLDVEERVERSEAEVDKADRLPIGMNLRMVGPRNRECVFVDIMKGASMWRYVEESTQGRRGRWGPGGTRPGGRAGRDRSGTRERGEQGSFSQADRRRQRAEALEAQRVPTDDRGWPTPQAGRAISCVMLAEQDGRYPSGTYVCTWEGAGTIHFERAARIQERGDQRLLVEVDPSRGEIQMRVEGFNPEDPIRDIHLWMPGFEHAESPFHPLFLERLKPFSVLRFYPWMRPFSSSGRWENRPTPADARQSDDDGVALEYMVALCNELKADPWFCIPHTADDEYVREFAGLVKQTLHKDARIWVEYSNELWNSGFVQAQWVRAEAKRRGMRTAELTALEATRIFRGWREVFGEQADRIVRVAAGQLHNPGVARVLCRGLGEEVDAIAIGAYFGARPSRDESGGGGDIDRLMAAARENLDTVVMQRIADHKKLAEQLSSRLGRHISLVSYEGGQHLVARSSQAAPGKTALSPQMTDRLQDHPQMYDAYRALIENGKRQGLELFVAYDFVGRRTHADTFGHLRFLDEPISTAPKFRALVEDWIESD
ncbi:MAG: hypothetical protein CMJ89_09785 [Planctomycetes bacterium]|jgi:hypothetical protein|nr:hypothetical protein [Planctomycetota bacterium]